MTAPASGIPPAVRLEQVRTGKAARLGNTDITTAIGKAPRAGKVALGTLGLEGDVQAQPVIHGGPDKAVLHYAAQHYDAWANELPDRAKLFQPGGFGENLVSYGLDETNVCIGDVVRVGAALLQVAQPRQPCFKLNHRFQDPRMSLRVQERGRTGWYCRVLEPGVVEAGDNIEIIERRYPEWPVRRVQFHLYSAALDHPALHILSTLEPLAEATRALFSKRLASMTVETWTTRLIDHNMVEPLPGKDGPLRTT